MCNVSHFYRCLTRSIIMILNMMQKIISWPTTPGQNFHECGHSHFYIPNVFRQELFIYTYSLLSCTTFIFGMQQFYYIVLYIIFHRSHTADDDPTGSGDGVNSSDADQVGANNTEGTSSDGISIVSSCEAPVVQAYDEATVDVDAFDIGSFLQTKTNMATLSDTEKFQLLTNHVRPDGKTPLAYQDSTASGKAWKISFQLPWLDEYPWLVYSPSQMGGYCKYCALYGNSKHGTLGVLVKTPFTNFRRAKRKDGVLTNHTSNRYHQEASDRAHTFITTYQNPHTRIDTRISIEAQRLSETNQHILSEIVQIILILGRQGLPLRGHRDDGTANPLANRGHFLALLEHTADRDPILKEHLLNGKLNQKYISKTIQNDIIITAAECLKERLLRPLHETTFYSIIADEVTDSHSNQELLSVCVRFLDLSTAKLPEIKEVFIDFIHLKRATGKLVGQAIMTLLRRNGLDVKDIRGQAYDGASAMSSDKVGTQAQIKAENPLAMYTHCRSHVLNLAMAGSCEVQALRNVIGVINQL